MVATRLFKRLIVYFIVENFFRITELSSRYISSRISLINKSGLDWTCKDYLPSLSKAVAIVLSLKVSVASTLWTNQISST